MARHGPEKMISDGDEGKSHKSERSDVELPIAPAAWPAGKDQVIFLILKMALARIKE